MIQKEEDKIVRLIKVQLQQRHFSGATQAVCRTGVVISERAHPAVPLALGQHVSVEAVAQQRHGVVHQSRRVMDRAHIQRLRVACGGRGGGNVGERLRLLDADMMTLRHCQAMDTVTRSKLVFVLPRSC